LMRGGQRCVMRASRACRATTTARAISHRGHRGHRDQHVVVLCVLCVLGGSMQFGSCQERASSFLDAGLPAVRTTRGAS
jgi:hypothetical protein